MLQGAWNEMSLKVPPIQTIQWFYHLPDAKIIMFAFLLVINSFFWTMLFEDFIFQLPVKEFIITLPTTSFSTKTQNIHFTYSYLKYSE